MSWLHRQKVGGVQPVEAPFKDQTVSSSTVASKTTGSAGEKKVKNQEGLAYLKAVARGADMDNDILQKVTNMWFLLRLLGNFCKPPV